MLKQGSLCAPTPMFNTLSTHGFHGYITRCNSTNNTAFNNL